MKTLDEQVLSAATGTLELFGLYLGDRLGLYEALADAGPVTVAELAERAGIHDGYAREWLEQQHRGALVAIEPRVPQVRVGDDAVERYVREAVEHACNPQSWWRLRRLPQPSSKTASVPP